MRKLWKYSILCSVVLLSLLLNFSIVKKSKAFEIVTPVDFTGRSWDMYNITCKYSDGTSVTRTTGNCFVPKTSNGNENLTQFLVNQTIDTVKNYYYKAIISVKTPDGEPAILYNMMTTTGSWNLISINMIESDYIDQNITIRCNHASVQPNQLCDEYTLYYNGESWTSEYAKFYEVTLQSKSDGSKNWSLGNGTTTIIRQSPNYISAGDNRPLVSIFNIAELKPVGTGADELNEKDEEDRNNIESQSSQTESDADQSKEDIEQGTSSLISTISSFSTMLTGIHTTNCKLPEISAYGFNLGRIDVCTFSPPSWVSVVGNVIVSLIAVRLAIAIFRRIMGIIKGVGQ